MSELFHFTMTRLGVGSVIQPGNWGRLLRRYENDTTPGRNLFGNAWILARELTFENVRLREFSSLPSRWECSYSLTTEADARVYQQRTDPPQAQVLHRVQLVDASLPSHIGAIDMTNYPPPCVSFMETTEHRSRMYWSGQGDGLKELLSLSPLKVVECLD